MTGLSALGPDASGEQDQSLVQVKAGWGSRCIYIVKSMKGGTRSYLICPIGLSNSSITGAVCAVNAKIR